MDTELGVITLDTELGVITLDTELGSHHIALNLESSHWTLNSGVVTLDTELGSRYIGLLLHKLHVITMQIRFMLLLLVLLPRLFGLSFCYFLVLTTIQLVPIGLMPQSCTAQ